MSDYGSILELSKVTLLKNVSLLIIANSTRDFGEIADPLYAADINFTYDLVTADCLTEKLPQQKYSAILYDNIHLARQNQNHSLIEKLQWWYHLYPHIPLILITDALGDERAVEVIQSGVSGYVLRDKLHQLPGILEKSLFDFVSKQAVIKQQQNSIEQQQQQIQQLEAEVQNLDRR